MKKYTLLIFVTMLFVNVSALAETMTFVTGGMSPPLVYKDGEVLKGMDLDVITEFCKENGITPKFEAFPWKRALMKVRIGEACGIFTLFRTDERDKFLFYPDAPINVVKTVVWARKGSHIRIRRLDDLKDKSLGVIAGYKYGPEFDSLPGLKKTHCNTKEQMILMLDKNRFDVAIDSEACFKFMCKELGIRHEEFEPIYVITENMVYVAFSKFLGEKGNLLSKKFSQFMPKLKESGRLEQIRERYLR